MTDFDKLKDLLTEFGLETQEFHRGGGMTISLDCRSPKVLGMRSSLDFQFDSFRSFTHVVQEND
jgi:hypothetical protein